MACHIKQAGTEAEARRASIYEAYPTKITRAAMAVLYRRVTA